ncbi:eukaryotic translation initiation factor 5B-like [Mangifera indica]|uniref:eukaryotic translation initiation factor 5B-like n=1 Tax=Mangifera indica TaxID=29780 RepID=UPI001CF96413|nr:eukaryotic translation initiation factor 5B-like [Mangifera indica]XP_044512297.1 eukaryotic translation initiation factor 5B-like [Mangifera indica]
MGRKKPTARDDENKAPVAAQGSGTKSKKKAVVIDDDEYSIGTELSEEPPVQEEKVVITGKKKGKKGNKKGSRKDDEDDDLEGEEKDDFEAIEIGGKKKSMGKKGGNSVFSPSAFGLLEEEDDNGHKDSEGEDDSVVSFSGKKKPSKKGGKKSGSLFTASAFDVIDGASEGESEVIDNDNDMEESKDDEAEVTFKGDNKLKKGGKKAGGSVYAASSFTGLDDDEGVYGQRKDEDDDVGPITFSGKKKKSSKSLKKSVVSFSGALLDEENDDDEPYKFEDEDEPVLSFTGKKKSSKKKSNSAFTSLDEESGLGSDITGVVEPEQQGVGTSYVESNDSKISKKEEVAETSKGKKKKKKSGRTAQEEDDLAKILAELGEAPAMVKPTSMPPQEEKVQVQPPVPAESAQPADAADEKEGEEEKEESAAAKKKKKKKEKEKEKKAAAAVAAAAAAAEETQEAETKKADGKNKGPKLSKQVREMQEALAKRKEAEERKKREEEERIRKEEEERKRQEELERQAEEARRRKKEKEKERLLKKKQEGKLLTGKQKEEARRLEAMRNQILANAGIALPAGDKESASPKRPKYQTKKSKPVQHQANGSVPAKVEEIAETIEKDQELQETIGEFDSSKTEKVEEGESLTVEEKPEVDNVPKQNGNEEEEEEDDDMDWDAKSWDDVNLNVKGAFDDEEVDFGPEPEVKKETNTAPVAATKAMPVQLVKSQDDENKKSRSEVEVTDISKRKEAGAKNKALSAGSTPKEAEENLRSPICCIMGHVDTGKTKLLDCIRGTNVQEGEAGGITQQIGATYFPAVNIRERTKELKADAKLKVPGLLVIDTPGHESFTNLRSRGSGLCDIAILVVDIMHGLEPQTIESLNLLKMRNTEFIIALNKVDRLYGWKTTRNAPIIKSMKQQSKDVQNEFNMRLVQIITQFKEQGLNTELYYKNKEMGETFSIVPTSAITGEGIPDLLLLLVQWSQKTMVEKLTFSNEVQCTVLEVKVIEGHGTTIDVVLVNGVLHEGDQIVVCGLQGPIVTTIRALLTPHPMKELRVKGTYLHHKEIKAAQGIKISAQGLEHAIAGTGLYVVGPDDDLDDIKEAAMEDMKSVMSRIDKSGEGVCVQASTLGSLEALLEFLKTPEVSIPVSGINIGPVHKKDVMKASVMLEKKKEYATILAFDVKVTPEARELAEELGVKIFIADIIYHLFDQFKAYIDNLKEEKKREAADEAVFPCVLKILPNCVFNKKDPIVLGVDVLEGIAKVGTPICIPQRDFIDIGRIASIENNHKPVDIAKKGQKVAIKIVGSNSEEQQKMYGRHFEIEDELVSCISRKSIDILKANYRDELSIDEWRLVVKLKNLFKIQ